MATAVFVLAGSFVSLLSAVGMIKFGTPYARFHAAGKASPVAFLLVVIGAGIETSGATRALLVVVAGMLILTLPVAVHLLFRAVHRTTDVALARDDLRAERRG
ncbi:MAG: monovalent cation/H(+) antiporter subunit G [Actinomycetota bacterium]